MKEPSIQLDEAYYSLIPKSGSSDPVDMSFTNKQQERQEPTVGESVLMGGKSYRIVKVEDVTKPDGFPTFNITAFST